MVRRESEHFQHRLRQEAPEKEMGDTEYCISAIPFGGYVAMAGEQPMDEGEGEGSDFHRQPIHKRAIIAFAGPFVNIVFAFLVLAGLFMVGAEEQSSSMMVGEIAKNSPASKSGLQKDDVILSLDGKNVRDWNDFRKSGGPKGRRIHASSGSPGR